jgi:uncharacterized SAM-binding protein YcdF (DUF218 family)
VRRGLGRALKLAALVVLAAPLLAYVFHAQLLSALGSYLDKSEPPRKADLAFVLAGDQTGNRILRAAELVRQGYVPKAMVSGPYGLYGFNECDLAIPFAEKAGYPHSYFLPFPNFASSTHEESAAAVAELRKMGVRNVLLVTSTFHTRRAGTEFRTAAPELTFVVVSAPDPHFTVNGWWHDREGRKTFLVEWIKTAAAWVHL